MRRSVASGHMPGRLRFSIALLIVASWFFLPAPDRGQLAVLQARAWLCGEASPLTEAGPSVPRLSVRVNPPSAPGESSPAEALAGLAAEWVRRQPGHTLDPLALPWRMQVDVTTTFTLVSLARPAARGYEEFVQQRFQVADRRSLLPMFVAVVVALLTSRVLLALLLGCLAGAWVWTASPLAAVRHFAGDALVGVLTKDVNYETLAFVLLLFAAIGVMARSGGLAGMVAALSRRVRGPKSAQLVTFASGLAVFFDDYTNCVAVGSGLRPLTDRSGLSREKLAYIVDTTAAPIAGLVLVSTWIAFEVSTFAPHLPEVTRGDGTAYSANDGYAVFLETMPFRFYCVWSLVLVLATILTDREIGPMRRAQWRARAFGKPLADDARPLSSTDGGALEPAADALPRARLAVLPLAALLVGTLAGLLGTGTQGFRAGPELGVWRRLLDVLAQASAPTALLLGSAAMFTTAALGAMAVARLAPRAVALAASRAMRTVLPALGILILAWAIGRICNEIGTHHYLTAAFQSRMLPALFPAATFLLASATAFCTGTSWGTMAVLLPNVVVLSHGLGSSDEAIGGAALMVMSIGAVLEGSIFGDHCSPLSDTTILSSTATGCDHLHHVITQAPYALTVMVVALLCGYLPAGWFGPGATWVCWVAGTVFLLGILALAGRRPSGP